MTTGGVSFQVNNSILSFGKFEIPIAADSTFELEEMGGSYYLSLYTTIEKIKKQAKVMLLAGEVEAVNLAQELLQKKAAKMNFGIGEIHKYSQKLTSGGYRAKVSLGFKGYEAEFFHSFAAQALFPGFKSEIETFKSSECPQLTMGEVRLYSDKVGTKDEAVKKVNAMLARLREAATDSVLFHETSKERFGTVDLSDYKFDLKEDQVGCKLNESLAHFIIKPQSAFQITHTKKKQVEIRADTIFKKTPPPIVSD